MQAVKLWLDMQKNDEHDAKAMRVACDDLNAELHWFKAGRNVQVISVKAPEKSGQTGLLKEPTY